MSFALWVRTEHKYQQLDLPSEDGWQQDIADYLGLTIETVCRMLTTLKQTGVIDVPNRLAIIIQNVPALRRAAQAED